MSRNYRPDSCPLEFDVLKTRIFSLEVYLFGQIFVLRTSNFAGQLSTVKSLTETLNCEELFMRKLVNI